MKSGDRDRVGKQDNEGFIFLSDIISIDVMKADRVAIGPLFFFWSTQSLEISVLLFLTRHKDMHAEAVKKEVRQVGKFNLSRLPKIFGARLDLHCQAFNSIF